MKIYYIPGKLMHFADLLSRNFNEGEVKYEDENDLKDVVHSVNLRNARKDNFIDETKKDQTS